MAMSPEGAAPQEMQQEPQGGGMGEGLKALQDGTSALLQALTDGGAPQEAVALAEQAATAIAQLTQLLSGGAQAPASAAAPASEMQS